MSNFTGKRFQVFKFNIGILRRSLIIQVCLINVSQEPSGPSGLYLVLVFLVGALVFLPQPLDGNDCPSQGYPQHFVRCP